MKWTTAVNMLWQNLKIRILAAAFVALASHLSVASPQAAHLVPVSPNGRYAESLTTTFLIATDGSTLAPQTGLATGSSTLAASPTARAPLVRVMDLSVPTSVLSTAAPASPVPPTSPLPPAPTENAATLNASSPGIVNSSAPIATVPSRAVPADSDTSPAGTTPSAGPSASATPTVRVPPPVTPEAADPMAASAPSAPAKNSAAAQATESRSEVGAPAIPTPPRRPTARASSPEQDDDAHPANAALEATAGCINGDNSCYAKRGHAKGHSTAALRAVTARTVAARSEAAAPDNAGAPLEIGSRQVCYARLLLASAERLQGWASRLVPVGKDGKKRPSYLHTNKSAGACTAAVHGFIAGAGFGEPARKGRIDAVDYWRRPHERVGNLEDMGFVNKIGEYTAETAPPGAVLVFAGPRTNEYERTGHYPPRGSKARGNLGAGTWVGHITVKGSQPNQYRTDGITYEPAVRNRTLVGVFLMNHCKTCATATKHKCGDN